MRKIWIEKNSWAEMNFLVHKKGISMILTQTKVTGRSSFHFEKIEIWSFFRILSLKCISDLRPCHNMSIYSEN